MAITDVGIFSTLRTRIYPRQKRLKILADNVANSDTELLFARSRGAESQPVGAGDAPRLADADRCRPDKTAGQTSASGTARLTNAVVAKGEVGLRSRKNS